MASTMAFLLVAFVCLVAIQVQASESNSLPVETVVSTRNTVGNELSLALLADPTCTDKLTCPKNLRSSVTYKYGRSSRSGSFEVLYDGTDLGLTLDSQHIGGAAKTYIKIGTSNDEQCCIEKARVLQTFSQLERCGFKQVVSTCGLICREVVVTVSHYFNTGVAGVHFFGSREILVKACLNVEPPKFDLPTPVYPLEQTIGSCSALTHKITVRAPVYKNTWEFSIEADNYNPQQLGVGFRLKSCQIRPYLPDGSISSYQEHAYPLIENYQLSWETPPVQNVGPNVPGLSYSFVIDRIQPRSDLGFPLFDETKDSVVCCSVCLCSMPNSPNSGNLPKCRDFTNTRKSSSNRMKNFVLLAERDNYEESPVSLQAGETIVVPDEWPMF